MSTPPASQRRNRNPIMLSPVSDVDRRVGYMYSARGSILPPSTVLWDVIQVHDTSYPDISPTPWHSDGVLRLTLCASVILPSVICIIFRILPSTACSVISSAFIQPVSAFVYFFASRSGGSALVLCSLFFIPRIYVMKTRSASRHGI